MGSLGPGESNFNEKLPMRAIFAFPKVRNFAQILKPTWTSICFFRGVPRTLLLFFRFFFRLLNFCNFPMIPDEKYCKMIHTCANSRYCVKSLNHKLQLLCDFFFSIIRSPECYYQLLLPAQKSRFDTIGSKFSCCFVVSPWTFSFAYSVITPWPISEQLNGIFSPSRKPTFLQNNSILLSVLRDSIFWALN